MSKMVLIMEYSGTHYHGFQLQSNLPTIQGKTEEALWKLTRERRRLITASRTDAGVHARAQVVSFRTGSHLPPQTFVKGLNYYLPRDIAVKAAYRVPDSFDVRREAIRREYRYYILNSSTRSPIWEGSAYHVTGNLDIEAMNLACQALIGEYDFASFATYIGDGIKSTIRSVYRAEIEKNEELVILNIVANSFLPHQVRNTVGTLVRVGLSKMTIHEFSNILERKEPGLAGPTAPACGLYLMQISYPQPLETYNENI